MGGIYCIENKINKKFYIGSTNDFSDRFGQHRTALERNDHVNRYLQNAWNKYGADNFEFNILEIIDDEFQLIIREQSYLDDIADAQIYIQTGRGRFVTECYNLSPTAGRTIGWKANEEQIERNRQSGIRLWQDPDYIEKQMKTRKSKEWIKSASNRQKELWKTQEFRDKISSIVRERFSDPEYKKWWKDVVCNNPERKQKYSNIMKERWQDPEFRDKMRQHNEDRKKDQAKVMNNLWNDPEWRQMQIEVRNSPQTKQRKSNSRYKWLEKIGDNNPNHKRVGAFNPDTNELIHEWISLKQAKEQFGKKCIKHYITNYPKVFHGLVWKYLT